MRKAFEGVSYLDELEAKAISVTADALANGVNVDARGEQPWVDKRRRERGRSLIVMRPHEARETAPTNRLKDYLVG